MSRETYMRLTTKKARRRAVLVNFAESVLMVAIAFGVGYLALLAVYGLEVLLGVAG